MCCLLCPVQAVEKLIVSKLLVEGSNKRIYNVDQHVGMVSVPQKSKATERQQVDRVCMQAHKQQLA